MWRFAHGSHSLRCGSALRMRLCGLGSIVPSFNQLHAYSKLDAFGISALTVPRTREQRSFISTIQHQSSHGFAAPIRLIPPVPYHVRAEGNLSRGFFSLPIPSGGTEKTLDMVTLVPFPPDHMYKVVADVGSYQQFLPFCCSSVILRWLNNNQFDAELAVGFKMFQERYTSRVHVDPERRVVRSTLLQSDTFSHLSSTWSLKPGRLPNQCRVEFHVEFHVKGAMHAAAINAFFEDV
eukprot:CAMPEP_0114283660 /NCGR_PEP_ID=MMETSP0059-20121206/4224_1 /TAXON_ID=36894 /ORGANISM="Pyramimonas parkeae, Strain CCMP726" /LENGTH=235 /DNA_ID=CAMNT_0001404411 /DNA_START=426 /DNA_END=1129 /DNA_ORIENTATION=-